MLCSNHFRWCFFHCGKYSALLWCALHSKQCPVSSLHLLDRPCQNRTHSFKLLQRILQHKSCHVENTKHGFFCTVECYFFLLHYYELCNHDKWPKELLVEHGIRNPKVMGSQEAQTDQKSSLHFKSLWMKALAKCIKSRKSIKNSQDQKSQDQRRKHHRVNSKLTEDESIERNRVTYRTKNFWHWRMFFHTLLFRLWYNRAGILTSKDLHLDSPGEESVEKHSQWELDSYYKTKCYWCHSICGYTNIAIS